MKRAFYALLLASWGPSVMAVEIPVPDPAFCQALTKHTPAADVAYQSGVNVRGQPVVPADLDSGEERIKLPEEIAFPLTLDLASLIALPVGLNRQEATLGTLSLRAGKVFWNGRPLTDEQQDNLSVLCLKPTGNASQMNPKLVK